MPKNCVNNKEVAKDSAMMARDRAFANIAITTNSGVFTARVANDRFNFCLFDLFMLAPIT